MIDVHTTVRERGVALLAVLFALVLLMLLMLPFSVSMTVGADAAARDVDAVLVQQASASARELLLAEAARSHPMVDPTPTSDGRDEWPATLALPKAFAGLGGDGTVLLGGQVVDQQRFLHLDSATPLLLANAIGTTTRLAKELLPDAQAIEVDDASNLPDEGYVWIAGELIQYGDKKGNSLGKLARGQLYPEFEDGKQKIRETALVLDYRCVLAAAWPASGPDPTRQTRTPYRAVGELLAVGKAGFGTFTATEMDALQRVFTIDTLAANAATWGRRERIFADLEGGKSRTLLMRSLQFGAGATVRITNLKTGVVEYGLVMSTATNQGSGELLFRPQFLVNLLFRVGVSFPASDTVVEPLLPVPINVNTASPEVLALLLAQVRPSADVRVHDGDTRQAALPRWISESDARAFADELVGMRASEQASTPFTGWQDFVERVWKPRFEAIKGSATVPLWVMAFRNLETGRDSDAEMGTAPLCFQSGPWVSYRAAASRARSTIAAGVAARHERTGTAAVMPGFLLEHRWATQEAFEGAIEIDRRSPFWSSTPINLGALLPQRVGLDPAPRYFPHLFALAYPGMGFGELRFPTKDEVDAGIEPMSSTTPSGPWANNLPALRRHASFFEANDRRGHDVGKLGPFAMINNGPSAPAAGGQQANNNPNANAGGGRHDQLVFPFSSGDGFVDRLALSFWAEPQALANTVLFEHGVGDPDRNRIVVEAKDDKLALRVFDEAGRDPDPGASPAGLKDSVSEWSVPLLDLNLPANTPVHVAVAATSGRPNDLSFAVDGMTRGKPKYVTHLTAALKTFDPTLANNRTGPTTSTNDRYLDVLVDSTEGFPPVGVVRIGLELFEYSSLTGNSFKCRWKDSLGGRGARQLGREQRPAIPTQNGKPVVSIDDPQFQGANLDYFPDHPAGSAVELYGYSAVLSEDTPMMVGKTSLTGAIGAFAVARGFIDNPRPITVTAQSISVNVGRGLDETWTGDLRLADPVPTRNYPPSDSSDEIANAFPTTGGYALLVQRRQQWQLNVQGQLQTTTSIGGVELIKYASRAGQKLSGVQRAQTLPGDDTQIDREYSDRTARKFVCDWNDWQVSTNPSVFLDEIPTLILWVVPVSIPVQSTKPLMNPQDDPARLVQWVQLYPDGGDVNDTEWVRYDAIADNTHLVRGNRAAWERTRYTLTRQLGVERVQVNQLGPSGLDLREITQPWGTVQATSGYIGYTPQLEETYPQIRAARYALRFRGDPMQDVYGDVNQARSDPNSQATSSHPHTNSTVMQCHRVQLLWGNFGAYTGRMGRLDRVALVQGSRATGSARPDVEWHTVNWVARRYEADNIPAAGQGQPPEKLGPWPFQLIAFQDDVRNLFLGPPAGTQTLEPRKYDRIVKFPSGELPAAWCEKPTVGGGIGNQQPMRGFVDEIEVHKLLTQDLVLDAAIDASAKEFRVNRVYFLNSVGATWQGSDLSAGFPEKGALVQIDEEIVAYSARAAGGEGDTAFATFTIATNGRGLLNTEARAHDRGARVKFLQHRPAAILANAVGVRDHQLVLQARGAMPENYGTVLLGRELLHYTWIRQNGEQVQLEMPRWYPPNQRDDTNQARGLFRGRYGTSPQSAGLGEPVIAFPFRYWDRFVEQSDDPELAYCQLTTNEAPVHFRTLKWQQETRDARVEVRCMVRADSKLPWEGDPLPAGGYWQFRKPDNDGAPHRLGYHAARLEIRFATVYKPGCVDLATFQAHGWKTTARVKDVRLEYDGETQIFDEQVTAR